ncbi:MAG: HEAT repeat domain-containing protein [Tepidiformaceae bacterium]
MLLYPEQYPPADVEALLLGLERFALRGAPSGLRAESAIRLATPATRSAPRPLPRVLPRLVRIYRNSEDPHVRSSVLGALGHLITDRAEAVAFLERAAAEERDDFAAQKALMSLLLQGEEARAALQRLYAAEAVQTPEARAILAGMARNGFRRTQ